MPDKKDEDRPESKLVPYGPPDEPLEELFARANEKYQAQLRLSKPVRKCLPARFRFLVHR